MPFRPNVSLEDVFSSGRVSWSCLSVPTSLPETLSVVFFCSNESPGDVFSSQRLSWRHLFVFCICLFVRPSAGDVFWTERAPLTEDMSSPPKTSFGGTVTSPFTWNHDFAFGAELRLRRRLSASLIQFAFYSPRAIPICALSQTLTETPL